MTCIVGFQIYLYISIYIYMILYNINHSNALNINPVTFFFCFWLVVGSKAFYWEWTKIHVNLLWWPIGETLQSNIILIYVYDIIQCQPFQSKMLSVLAGRMICAFRRCAEKTAITHVNLLRWPNGETHQCHICSISQIAKFMGPRWGPPGSCRPQMGPMLAPRTLLSGMSPQKLFYCISIRFIPFWTFFLLWTPAGVTHMRYMSLQCHICHSIEWHILYVRWHIRGYPAKRALSAMRKHGG